MHLPIIDKSDNIIPFDILCSPILHVHLGTIYSFFTVLFVFGNDLGS